MLKTALLLTLGVLTHLASASKCSIKLTAYSDSSCTTTKDYPPLYPGGQASYDLQFDKCYSPSAGGMSANLKMLYCEPDSFVAVSMFTDNNCKNKALPSVRGWEYGVCQIIAPDTWVTITDINLNGNKYGIGWKEGWAIFLCQTMLFGICQGF